MNRKRLSSILIVLLTIILTIPLQISISQETETYGLAVLDLEPIGISEVEAKALSGMLRSSITKIINKKNDKIMDFYELIERSQIDKIFEQFEIQNTGCTDVACAVEFGKMLSVERIVIGSVSLVGSTYIIIARIVDVESGRAIYSVDRKQSGIIDNVIDLMPLVGHELLTGERLKAPIVTPQTLTSTQPVNVSPIVNQKLVPTEAKSVIVGIEMVSIPAGTFQMGDISGEGSYNERPVHDVTISSFEMSIYEITQVQYRAITASNPQYLNGSNNMPVNQISWYSAVEFCNKLSDKAGFERCYDDGKDFSKRECDFSKNGFRLPTEAEWEYACRAGTTTKYNTGNTEYDLERAGWYVENSMGHSHPVGLKMPNAWGLYDMHGNVKEWCQDMYNFDYYSESPGHNPINKEGNYRVMRGGSCRSSEKHYRAASRDSNSDSNRAENSLLWGTYSTIGFRVVRRPN